MKNIEFEVLEVLKKADVSIDFRFIASRDDKEWQHDLFLCGFNGEFFEYKCGIGHRLTYIKGYEGYGFQYYTRESKKKVGELKKIFNGLQVSFGNVALPTPASVLYCLTLDSSAIDESFDNWCDIYGYSSDSIDALNTYKTCCDNAKKLYRAIGRPVLNAISDLLEEGV